jgi:hypothetical protein
VDGGEESVSAMRHFEAPLEAPREVRGRRGKQCEQERRGREPATVGRRWDQTGEGPHKCRGWIEVTRGRIACQYGLVK